MLFFVDECLPRRLCTQLAQLGHDVTYASDVCRSAADDVVLALATSQGRIMVTEDRDFGTLTMRFGHLSIGVVIAHVQEFPGDIDVVVDLVTKSIHDLGTALLGCLTTVEPGRVRQRALPSKP